MPTPTYTPLANTTLATSVSSVTFSSISQLYRDLIFVISGNASASVTVSYRLNGDSTDANYSWVRMQGNGSTASSTTGANAGISAAWTATDGNLSITHVMDYSSTDKHKTTLTRSDSAANLTRAVAGRWANTAAVTSVTLAFTSSISGLTIALYGVAA